MLSNPLKCNVIMYKFIFLWMLTIGFMVNAQGTLEQVRERGKLNCGVNAALPGFSSQDESGNFSGFDVDFCRAVAAAVLGDADAVTYRSLLVQDRFEALISSEVDILIRNTTWTSARDSQKDINFAPTIFYDAQGIMVPKQLGITSLAGLSGRRACFLSDTTTEINLADVMIANGLSYIPLAFNEVDEILTAYEEGKCEAWSADRASLIVYRQALADPSQHEILPEKISKEPLAPVVRHGDDTWFDIVKWTVFATFLAEEYGVSSSNIAQVAEESSDANVRRLLGLDPEHVKQLKLEPDAFRNVIAQVGNYAEIYERNWGQGSFGIPRDFNKLYTEEGGLLYAPPMR